MISKDALHFPAVRLPHAREAEGEHFHSLPQRWDARTEWWRRRGRSFHVTLDCVGRWHSHALSSCIEVWSIPSMCLFSSTVSLCDLCKQYSINLCLTCLLFCRASINLKAEHYFGLQMQKASVIIITQPNMASFLKYENVILGRFTLDWCK